MVYPETVQKRLKTEEEINTDKEVRLVPNPADKEVTLYYNFGSEGTRKVAVSTSNGSIILETTHTGSKGRKEINTSEWASGMYLFKITDQNKTEVVDQ